ncbi:MAG: hypothetical protein QM576_05925 [Rhodopseudomonas sp.]|uniref:hypothetical protein n=1 Tax=Rhodopseudomonas sp. TaxID=1078 RepID=UPI0039E68F94
MDQQPRCRVGLQYPERRRQCRASPAAACGAKVLRGETPGFIYAEVGLPVGGSSVTLHADQKGIDPGVDTRDGFASGRASTYMKVRDPISSRSAAIHCSPSTFTSVEKHPFAVPTERRPP